jgi:predicted ATPase
MRRFIITGAPGAGKTAIIRQLELDGFSVVEEAATDVLAAAHARGTAEPWMQTSFIDVRFEQIHEETYRNLGFELVFVEPGSLMDRVGAIKAAIR